MMQPCPRNPLPFTMLCLLLLIIACAFSTASAQTLTTLFAFNGTDGAEPFQSNLLDIGGTLYGTTGYGGTYNAGTILVSTAPAKKP